jgi:hypothetical protein
MEEPSNRIRVPKPSRSSFNPERPLHKNTLLQDQVKHFRELEKQLAPEHHSGIDHEAIRTEGEAAEYIRRLTARVHQPSAKKKISVKKTSSAKKKKKGK